MIIIGSKEPWPAELVIDRNTGIPKSVELSFRRVIMEAEVRFWHKAGFRPTHLLIPRRFEWTIKGQLDYMHFVTFKPNPDERDKMLGHEVVWVDRDDPMEILGDPNP